MESNWLRERKGMNQFDRTQKAQFNDPFLMGFINKFMFHQLFINIISSSEVEVLKILTNILLIIINKSELAPFSS